MIDNRGNKYFALEIFFAVITAVLIFIVYLPALKNGFVNWDDHLYVYENLRIREINLDLFKWAFTSTELSNYHPLTLISLAVDFAIFGLDPKGYHITNNFIHALNTFLVFLLSSRLVSIATGGNDNRRGFESLLIPLATALIFGLHPLRVESVVWISERKDILCAFFYLLSVLSYIAYTSAGGARAKGRYIGAFVFALLAVLSKPMAVSLPIVLLIIDLYPLERFKSVDIKKIVIEKIPFFCLSIFIATLTVVAQGSGGAISTITDFPLYVRLLVAARALFFYIYKTFLPLSLSPLYPYPSEVTLSSFEFAVPLILFLAVTALVIILFKKSRVYAALWCFYLVTLLPVIGIIQVGGQSAADRYTYLPALALAMLAGLALNGFYSKALKGRHLWPAFIILFVASGLLAAKTVKQTALWKDSLSLWNHAIELYPGGAFQPYAGRAEYYMERGDFRLALKDFDHAVRLDPRRAESYNSRGSAHFMLGDLKLALSDYRRTIELEPDFALAHYNSALIYSRLGEEEKALAHYRRAAKLGVTEAEQYLRRNEGRR